MRHAVHWEWASGPFIRAYLGAAQLDSRNLRLYLPSAPGKKMSAVISYRLVQFALQGSESLKIGKREVQRSALTAFEHLLTVFCGTDFSSTLLVDRSVLALDLPGAGMLQLDTVLVWDAGVFAAFDPSEIPLDEEYWIERALLQNELQHHAEELEE